MSLKWIFRASIVGFASIVAVSWISMSGARAQSWQLLNNAYALKSGETTEVMDLYWVINCMSQLTSPPEVTVLDGPPGVTATVTEAMVMPRFQQCAKPVEGAKLRLHADKIKDYSQTIMTIRVKYQTKDGERQRSLSFSMTLFP